MIIYLLWHKGFFLSSMKPGENNWNNGIGWSFDVSEFGHGNMAKQIGRKTFKSADRRTEPDLLLPDCAFSCSF